MYYLLGALIVCVIERLYKLYKKDTNDCYDTKQK